MTKFLHNRKIQIGLIQILVCAITFIIFSCAANETNTNKIPAPQGFINDFEHVFTPPEKNRLESLLQKIEKETTIEMSVVTLDTSFTTKAGFDSTTLYIAKKWGVGKKTKNNGILIGFSKGMRKIRIQNGFGIEKKISGEQTGEIIDSIIIPQFKKGNSYEGIRQGILALYDKTK